MSERDIWRQVGHRFWPLVGQKNKGVALSAEIGLFSLRRAKVEEHIELGAWET